jgi:hypothetical protein
MVVWDEPGCKVRLYGHVIDVAKYKAKLHNTLQDTIDQMHKKVLRGLTLPSSSLGLPDKDDYDQTTRGHGLFPFSLADFKNPEHPASFFFEALCSQGTLCKSTQDGILSWDHNEVTKWLGDVAATLSQIYLLLHMLSPPGRGTEEVLWQHANSAESRRHLFCSQTLNTLVMIGNYDKGTAATGLYKCIVRVIPCQVAALLSTFLRVVRPVELLLTLTFLGGNMEKERQLTHLYRTRLFVSFGKPWDPQHLSDIIQDWYLSNLEIPVGLRLHRHFAQALLRQLYSKSAIDPSTQLLSKTANLALGHGREAGEMNYARQDSDVLTMTQHEHFERVGKHWIEYLDFKVHETL